MLDRAVTIHRVAALLRILWRDTGPRAAGSALAVLLVALCGSGWLLHAARAADQGRFEAKHAAAAALLTDRFDDHRRVLRGLSTLFAAEPDLSRDAFRRAVAALDRAGELPAAVAIGYVRAVAPEEAPGFVAEARRTGAPGFEVRVPRDAATPRPAAGAQRLIVAYVEPADGDLPVLGLDLASEPRRLAAAEAAERTGRTSLSDPIHLIRGNPPGLGFLALRAVGDAGPDRAPGTQRAWVYLALRAEPLLGGLGEASGGELRTRVFAAASGWEPLGGDELPGSDTPLRASRILTLGGKRWRLDAVAGRGFAHASRAPASALAASGFAAAAIVLLFFRTESLNRRRRRAETRRQAVEAQARLLAAATQDTLTGLLNRTAFTERLEAAVEAAPWRPHQHHAVLFLDFDRFKEVNDTLGHAAGDALLASIAQRLEAGLRHDDAATAGRIGGDEFVVLLEGLRCPDDAVAVAERLLDDLAHPHEIRAGTVVSTASIGVAVGGPGVDDAPSLLSAADAAMYAAKRAGRSAVRVHEPAGAAPRWGRLAA
ncbi:sensor domain-containing diguanylate cyclase [Phycisphaera mikurensis]|uniref:GGDEF domain-containing protein n=1 Tax=Phycisphaera mikurensis (strain NBRC 102666 / KCTC 22515 / FYK2301M01) TaxID=1142394 RepID=I0IJ86_PHYMF|nr:sensor domain-containing diguanylate cyclase [Phycisphaera mikurensis]MBB6441876.1 diguanylate cyclase (GGDEF)-like protein [Phycisphaera mikurensis]BAM05324.1 hypothetical protein PSMK_31650 [Phycisphaera mikurensis NBRC 102666]